MHLDVGAKGPRTTTMCVLPGRNFRNGEIEWLILGNLLCWKFFLNLDGTYIIMRTVCLVEGVGGNCYGTGGTRGVRSPVPSSDNQALRPRSIEQRCGLARSVCICQRMRGGEMQASSRRADRLVRSDHETPSAFVHQTCVGNGTGLDEDTPSLSKAYRVGHTRDDKVAVQSWHGDRGSRRTASAEHVIDSIGPGIDLGGARRLGSDVFCLGGVESFRDGVFVETIDERLDGGEGGVACDGSGEGKDRIEDEYKRHKKFEFDHCLVGARERRQVRLYVCPVINLDSNIHCVKEVNCTTGKDAKPEKLGIRITSGDGHQQSSGKSG